MRSWRTILFLLSLLRMQGCLSERPVRPRMPSDPKSHPRIWKTKQDKKSLGPYEWYLHQCTDRPIRTKSVTAAIIGALGDVLSQRLLGKSLSLQEVAAFFLVGLLYVGPFVHVWYEVLNRLGRYGMSCGLGPRGKVLMQLVVDQTLGVLIFFPSYFFAYEGMDAVVQWRRPSLSKARETCVEQIGKVFWMQYRIFPLCNWVNFSLVPEPLRVLFSNTVSVFWNIYLCRAVAAV